MTGVKAILMCSVGSLMFSGGAWAQAADEVEGPSDIIVMAQKRAQNVQEVPISISVVTGENLERSGIIRLESLGTTVPNFSVAAYGISDAVTIRGISSNNTQGSDQAVGIFVDGVYRGRGIQSRFGFLDLDHIEVLRGPQGTLFGKNTLAGAVNISTAKPTETLEAGGQALYEFNNNELDLRGYISGPITDTLSARLAFSYVDLDKGWIRNDATGQNMPQKRDWAVRGTVAWEPSDQFKLTTRYEHGDIRQRGHPLVYVEAGIVTALEGTFGLPLSSDGIGRRTAISNAYNPLGLPVPPGLDGPIYAFDGDSDEVSMTGELELAGGVLTAAGAYSRYQYDRGQDVDFSTLPLLQEFDDEKYSQGSIEVRYASDDDKPFYYLLGGFYQKEHLDAKFGTVLNARYYSLFAPAFAALPDGVRYFASLDQRATTWALFGQASYKPAESVVVTVGLRYGSVRKRGIQGSSAFNPVTGDPLTDPGQLAFMAAALETQPHSTRVRISDKRFLPMASVRWEVAPRINIYASVSAGSQDGGFNSFNKLNPALLTYDPINYNATKSIDYEFGVKADLLDRKLTVNLNYFNNKFTDLQVLSYTGNASFIVDNAASARAQGVEFEFRARPIEPLSLGVSGAYTDFRYLDFVTAGCTVPQIIAGGFANGTACANSGANDLTGRQNIHAPKWTATADFAWRQPIGDYALTLTGQAAYSASYYVASDLDPLMRQGGFTKYDASVSFGPADGRWEVALVGRNLTNKLTMSGGDDTPTLNGTYHAWIDRPRTVALRLSGKF